MLLLSLYSDQRQVYIPQGFLITCRKVNRNLYNNVTRLDTAQGLQKKVLTNRHMLHWEK